MSILLKNCDWIVTQNASREILRNCSVYVEDGRIVEIGGKITCEADRVLNCEKKVLMPGLINTHTHLSMTLFRGYADDMPLQEWLTTKIWPLESKLTGQLCYQGALLGCLEMIRTGTTCFLDMYYFLENIVEAVKKTGIRAFLSHAIIDLFDAGSRDKHQKATQESINFIETLGDPKIGFAIAPHAPYTCSEESLLWAREVAERENALIHIHIAEMRREQAEFEKKHGLREVEYLDKIGFLCPRVVSAHSVWLTKREVKLLGEKGVKVSHCPVSNMKLALGGVAPLPEMFESKVTVSLGTDGAASNNCLDMFDTMKFCALLHKAHRWDPTVLPAQKVLDLATVEGAKALGIEERVGSIEEGKDADLILIDLKSPNLMPIHGKDTVVSDIVYSAKGLNVATSMINGQILVEDGVFQKLDEEEIYREVEKAALDFAGQPR